MEDLFKPTLHHFGTDIVSSSEANFKFFIFDCDGVIAIGRHVVPGALETLFKVMQDPTTKLFLLSNNAMLSRIDFFKKYLNLFKDSFGAESEKYQKVQSLFKLEMCYNAGYVLAQELSNKIQDKAEKIIVVAPAGVVQELK
jgi:4-nitrophenyl phosphatase